MRTVNSVLKIQEQYALRDNLDSSFASAIPYHQFIKNLRIFLDNQNNIPHKEVYTNAKVSQAEKINCLNEAIDNYIRDTNPQVQGYIQNSVMDNLKLARDAKREITGAGILQDAFEDKAVEEIQINDCKTIFVLKNGAYQPYVNSAGVRYSFSCDQDIIDMVNRLVNDGTTSVKAFSENNPLYNGSVAGWNFRLSATHALANAMSDPPLNCRSTTVTIRKPSQTKLCINDLVNFGTMTQEMADFSMLLARTKLKKVYVGETGSGKTTLMHIHNACIPHDQRIIFIQNPTECRFFERNPDWSLERNVVHWEADSMADADNPTANTMAHLVEHTLRNTPDVIVLGEARTPPEFQQIKTQIETGQLVIFTTHSGSAEQLLLRVSGALHCSVIDAARMFDIVFLQEKFKDANTGKTVRKVSMSEISVDIVNGEEKVNINHLYTYVRGSTFLNPNTNQLVTLESFEHVGYPSRHIIQALNDANIPLEMYINYLSPEDQKRLQEEQQGFLNNLAKDCSSDTFDTKNSSSDVSNVSNVSNVSDGSYFSDFSNCSETVSFEDTDFEI